MAGLLDFLRAGLLVLAVAAILGADFTESSLPRSPPPRPKPSQRPPPPRVKPPPRSPPPRPKPSPRPPPPPGSSPPLKSHELSQNYYATSCPEFYTLVPQLVANYTSAPGMLNGNIPVRLIRLLFHDCMTHGCDASIMLLGIKYTSPDDGSVNHVPSERDASDNLMFGGMTGGYPQITGIKSALESSCPGKVSCADVIIGAAYAGLAQVAPNIASRLPIRYGRLDSFTSNTFDSDKFIPHQWLDPSGVRNVFRKVNLSDAEYVALLGTHTMGTANCWRFYERLKFGVAASLFNPEYLAWLNSTCVPENGQWPWIALDNVTKSTFDNQYFKNVLSGRGLLATDARLVEDPSTLYWVQKFASNAELWYQVYAEAFLKLSETSVLTGVFGEVRRDCEYINAESEYVDNPYPPSTF